MKDAFRFSKVPLSLFPSYLTNMFRSTVTYEQDCMMWLLSILPDFSEHHGCSLHMHHHIHVSFQPRFISTWLTMQLKVNENNAMKSKRASPKNNLVWEPPAYNKQENVCSLLEKNNTDTTEGLLRIWRNKASISLWKHSINIPEASWKVFPSRYHRVDSAPTDSWLKLDAKCDKSKVIHFKSLISQSCAFLVWFVFEV